MQKLIGWGIIFLIAGALVGGGYWLGQWRAAANSEQTSTETPTDQTDGNTTASLTVDSEPQGAAITLDGEDTGEVTPTTFEALEPGSYQIQLNHEQTYAWWVETELSRGDQQTIRPLLVLRETGVIARDSELDEDRLSMVSTYPGKGALLTESDLAPGGTFEVRMAFDRALRDSIAWERAISLVDAESGKAITIDPVYDPNNLTVVVELDPETAGLTNQGRYRVILQPSLKPVEGNGFDEAMMWEFGQGSVTSFGSVSELGSASTQDTTVDSDTTDTTDTENDTTSDATDTTDSSTGADATRKADLATVQQALEAYLEAYLRYPVLAQGGDLSSIEASLVTEFLDSLPQDPERGSDQATGYAYQSDGETYQLSVELDQATADGETNYVLVDASSTAEDAAE